MRPNPRNRTGNKPEKRVKDMTEMKRNSFDRPQDVEVTNTTLEIIRDKEPLVEGWERVYTSSSIINLDHACDKFRFGTGDAKTPKWHNEQLNPAANVVYCNCWEYHCRRHDKAIWGVYAATEGDRITVVWHGYDKLIRER